MNDGKQIECLADKYKYFSDEQKLDKDNVFTLDRLCLYKRKSDWEKDKTDKERIEIARNQLFPNIGVCIDDDSDNPEDLTNLLQKFYSVDYPKNRMFIVIYSKFNRIAARIPRLVTETKLNGIHCSSVFAVEDNVFENETSVFSKMEKATFLARLSSKSNINLQASLDGINKIFNDELGQKLVFRNEDALFISKQYVSRSYLEFLDYRKMEKAIMTKVIDTEFLYDIT